MRYVAVVFVLAVIFGPIFGQQESLNRPVATYSIVAIDSATGHIGVAVQSHWFSVGSIVPWAEAGVGAVATQSFVDPRYGPLGLELMRMGRTAEESLRALVDTDADREVRQVAMIDKDGNIAVHTGSKCIFAAGHRKGNGYSVQANLMESPTVWDAMAEAYETAEGDLADRLLAALEAAEKEGGDIRGKQSASLLIVTDTPTGYPWVDRVFDLRIEDHPEPVAELRRLVGLARVYHKLNEGDEWVTKNDIPKAMEAYSAALEMLPDEATNGEAAFWTGVTLASIGRSDEAVDYLRRSYRQDVRWGEVIGRLPAAGLLPDDELLHKLTEEMKK